jgi:hypothetical protein
MIGSGKGPDYLITDAAVHQALHEDVTDGPRMLPESLPRGEIEHHTDAHATGE